jgi:hypothetical protein
MLNQRLVFLLRIFYLNTRRLEVAVQPLQVVLHLVRRVVNHVRLHQTVELVALLARPQNRQNLTQQLMALPLRLKIPPLQQLRPREVAQSRSLEDVHNLGQNLNQRLRPVVILRFNPQDHHVSVQQRQLAAQARVHHPKLLKQKFSAFPLRSLNLK